MSRKFLLEVEFINRNRAIIKHPCDPNTVIALDRNGMTLCGNDGSESLVLSSPGTEGDDDEGFDSLSEVLFDWHEDLEENKKPKAVQTNG